MPLSPSVDRPPAFFCEGLFSSLSFILVSLSFLFTLALSGRPFRDVHSPARPGQSEPTSQRRES